MPDAPSVREVTGLLRELRRITRQGAEADPADREAFLERKREILERIERAQRGAGKVP